MFNDFLHTARADHELCCTQLLIKKRGYPLWVPGPGQLLPIEYLREGISIGDVGIISSLGTFDFLFNIFQPADHPINRGRVPRDFSPVSLEEVMLDIREDMTYEPDSYLTGPSVRRISTDLMRKVLFHNVKCWKSNV